MGRTTSSLLASSAALLLLAGCADSMIIPRAMAPRPLSPLIKPVDTLASARLDCISQMLQPYDKDNKVRVVVGLIPNKMNGNSLGEVTLPTDARDLVMQSLGRVSNVFLLHSTGDPLATNYNDLSLDELGVLTQPGIGGAIDIKAVKPHLFIHGSLSIAHVANAGEGGFELFGGLNSQSKAYDVTLQLRAVRAADLRVYGSPVSLAVTLYTTTQGMSAFFSKGTMYAKGEQQISLGAPTSYGLQLLSDSVVAELLTSLAISQFNFSLAPCRSMDVAIARPNDDHSAGMHQPHQGGSSRGTPSQPQQQPSPLFVRLTRDRATYCAILTHSTTSLASGSKFHVRFIQYRSNNKIVGNTVDENVTPEVSKICLPQEHISVMKQRVEVIVQSPDGTVLASDLMKDES